MIYNSLCNVANYVNDKVLVKNITLDNYITTENMLPEKAGVITASNLPSTTKANAYQQNDILISNIRPYFKKIWYADKLGGCSNDILIIRAKEGTNPRFLYYVLSDNAFFDYSVATSKGTKMPRGDKKAIMLYKIPSFEYKNQQAIAAMLSCLDDKIELNNKINTNLEAQAQAIFKNWFVDFEPFKDGEFVESELGTIPKEWRLGTIGDYAKVKSGFAFKSSWWRKEGIKVIKIKNISSGKLNLNDCDCVSEVHVQLASDFFVSGGEILIAMTGATLGEFSIVPYYRERLVVNQRVGKFFLGENPLEKLPFLHNTLLQPDIKNKIVTLGQGSAQPNISAQDIQNICIIIPNKGSIESFNAIVKPIYELILKNLESNFNIIQLRDTLLPKLMNGEIEVPVTDNIN